MMFIPSNVKITKTKLYSGDLRVDYNNTFTDNFNETKELYFNVDFSVDVNV